MRVLSRPQAAVHCEAYKPKHEPYSPVPKHTLSPKPSSKSQARNFSPHPHPSFGSRTFLTKICDSLGLIGCLLLEG